MEKYQNTKKILQKKEQKTIKFLDSYCDNKTFNNYSFAAFKSINDIYYLIYSNIIYSMIIYDIINNKKINEIKTTDNSKIIYFKYFSDIKNKREFMLTISLLTDNLSKSLKIWNVINFECIYNFKNINNLYSACILNDNNNELKIIMNCPKENLHIYDFKGNKIKDLNIENKSKISIELFYDKELNKNYIIYGDDIIDNITSYDYNENKIYHKYDNYDDSIDNLIIDKEKNKVILMYVTKYGNITLWDFHTGKLLKSVSICYKDNFVKCICFWNYKYSFLGFNRTYQYNPKRHYYFHNTDNINNSIRIINLDKKEMLTNFISITNGMPKTLKKINHPKKGDYLISQDESGEIAIFDIAKMET